MTEIIEALERFVCGDASLIGDADLLSALAKALREREEAWQHRNDHEALHLVEEDDDPTEWSAYRRVLVIPWPKDKP